MILTEVKEKYPSKAEKIEDLFNSNQAFRSVCYDFSYCKHSIEKLKQDYVDKKDALKDFEQLMIDLEEEMKAFLEK